MPCITQANGHRRRRRRRRRGHEIKPHSTNEAKRRRVERVKRQGQPRRGGHHRAKRRNRVKVRSLTIVYVKQVLQLELTPESKVGTGREIWMVTRQMQEQGVKKKTVPESMSPNHVCASNKGQNRVKIHVPHPLPPPAFQSDQIISKTEQPNQAKLYQKDKQANKPATKQTNVHPQRHTKHSPTRRRQDITRHNTTLCYTTLNRPTDPPTHRPTSEPASLRASELAMQPAQPCSRQTDRQPGQTNKVSCRRPPSISHAQASDHAV